jgi:hypothetical protein
MTLNTCDFNQLLPTSALLKAWLDVGAIGCKSFFSLVPADNTLLVISS